ncbi:metal-dependent hydrolase [Actinomadura scrupuli]|uniref:metal-dependent hydrolase n=1 Tax=Actinomadura scrupuli TaxID=559629 RepID=UPI003D98CB60
MDGISAPDGATRGIDERHPLIKPRRVSFDWEQTPLHWIPGDPVATHLINCFHLMLPTGERWFIECVRDAQPEITDERLLTEVKGFIGQEMVHARAHQGVLERLLEGYGIDHRKLTEAAERRNDERPARRAAMPPRKRRRLLMFELAMVAAIEHYTAVLGQWIIDDRGLERAGTDPTMLDMLRWHGAEEVEHRSVVFDVYRHLGGKYPMRVAAYVFSLALMAYGTWPGAMELMRQDPTVHGKVTFPRVFVSYLRSVRRGHLPAVFRMFARQSLVYLRPAHHPSRVASTQQALDYLATSPAATAARR